MALVVVVVGHVELAAHGLGGVHAQVVEAFDVFEACHVGDGLRVNAFIEPFDDGGVAQGLGADAWWWILVDGLAGGGDELVGDVSQRAHGDGGLFDAEKNVGCGVSVGAGDAGFGQFADGFLQGAEVCAQGDVFVQCLAGQLGQGDGSALVFGALWGDVDGAVFAGCGVALQVHGAHVADFLWGDGVFQHEQEHCAVACVGV